MPDLQAVLAGDGGSRSDVGEGRQGQPDKSSSVMSAWAAMLDCQAVLAGDAGFDA